MKLACSRLLFTFISILGYLYSTMEVATAQVTPDNTVNTQVNQKGEVAEITGGATRGDNLFHSFQDFSIPTGNEAFFNNANNIANIFSRVTGGNISNIDGLIRANGSANLFLINPEGIIFNENARLDIGGSFLATTAERIKFDDGEFSALDTEEPILSVNVPIGLGFGSNPGAITVRGESNNVVVELPSFRVNTDNLPEVLAVKSGKNISLIGGKIDFVGGGLQAPGGRIELGSVADNQEVTLTDTELGWVANFEQVSEFQDISLSQAAYLDTSSQRAGSIELDGRQIRIDDGSAILANSALASEQKLIINATELLELKGSADLSRQKTSNSVSLIAADILDGSSGMGNDIEVNVGKLRIFDGASLRAINFSDSESKTGEIEVVSPDILIDGNSVDGAIFSRIANSTGLKSRGNANNVTLNTQRLTLNNGGRIRAATFGGGDAGDIVVNAETITMSGVNPFLFSATSGFDASSIGKGEVSKTSNAGNIFVTTNQLSMSNGSQIISSANGAGTAGNIEITAQNIGIVGFNPLNKSIGTAIITTNSPASSSDSGKVDINTNSLKIIDGASIGSGSQSRSGGNGGDININAQDIELQGTKPMIGFLIGGISSIAAKGSNGQGGNINIETNSLKVADGSLIRAISLGKGDAGNINIDAQETIEVSGFDRFAEFPPIEQRISKINTSSQQTNGGNVVLNSNLILLDNLGIISASSNSVGSGGNIEINTSSLVALDNNQITANALDLRGGNIDINTNGFFISPNSQITASSELGIDGTVQINTPDINFQKELEQSELKLLTAEKAIANSCLARNNRNSSFTLGSSGGLPKNPNSNYSDANFSLTGVSELPIITTESIPTNTNEWRTSKSIVPAEKMVETEDGRIFLVAAPQQAEFLFCDRQT